ncbi:hypothetical protein GCM10009677_57400 [Sphaerisporangium rubeum]|uniref:Uncharacterized protein n=1 Tax=Sphaerisporangium rubeum TaxID=321317 RepID=A0A7X0IHZ5_9ACTN|nr:hypothetical protein [Sphaerisporangium rubeum]MBB6474343.1 hypothetical protein [Sphaerisporangium rubeum]
MTNSSTPLDPEEPEGSEDPDPEYELRDHSPPPADDPVVCLEPAAERHRGWFLKIFLGIFVAVIVASILMGAFLPKEAWGQVEPQVTKTMDWVFQVGLLVAGYLFGRKDN